MFKEIIDSTLDFFCNSFFRWWANKKHEKLLNSLKFDLKIYELLENLVKDVNGDRISFIYMHNGGGSIVPGKTKFISVILEKVSDNSLPSRKDDFQRVVVGDRYLMSIVDMIFADGNIIIRETDRLPRCKMREVYELDNIKTSVIGYIASNPDNIWYININFKKDINLSLEDSNKIYTCRNKIANILENYFTLTHRI